MTEQKTQYNATGHEAYYNHIKEAVQKFAQQQNPLCSISLDFLEDWANKMEQRMNGGPLTKKIIDEAWDQARPQVDAARGVESLRFMCDTWAYGDQLIPFTPDYSMGCINPDWAKLTRALTTNENWDFIRNYPDAEKLDTTTINGQEQENVRILTKVFPNVALIDTFEKVATKSSKKGFEALLSWVPIMKIEEPEEPDQELLNFAPDLKETFQDGWKNEVNQLCRLARLQLTGTPAQRKAAARTTSKGK